MEPLRPIRWREGMFLRPHHFQQHDLQIEARESARFDAVFPDGWGLVSLSLEEALLKNFTVAVRAMRAVLPDGTLVDVPGNARLASRVVDPQAHEVGIPIDVRIGVRRLEERRPSTSDEAAGAVSTRWVGVHEDVYDLDTGRDPNPVEKSDFEVMLFLGQEPSHGYEEVPVARLALTGNPAEPLRVVQEYAPPSMRLSASVALAASVRGVVEILANRLRELESRRGGDSVQHLVLLAALGGTLAVLRDMLADGTAHPREAFRELSRLAGALYFNDKESLPYEMLPSYDHRDPGSGFDQLRRLIDKLSVSVFKRQYVRAPMVRTGDQFHTALPAEATLPGVRLFLEIAVGDTPIPLPQRMLAARISSPTRMETLTRFVLPGMPTEVQVAAPPEMGPGQKAQFFRIKIEQGAEWITHVVPAKELAVFLLGAPPDMTIHLVVVLPGA